MSCKMVLSPEAMLLELRGKLPKSPEFHATIGLRHQIGQFKVREDLNSEEKVALYGHASVTPLSELFTTSQWSGEGKDTCIYTTIAEDVEVAAAFVANAADPGSSELEEQVIKKC